MASTGTPRSWKDVLTTLDERRSAAFATGAGALLGEVYAAGSAPLARDVAVLTELTGRHLRADGLRLHVDEVTVVSAGTTSATLLVVDHLAPYRLVDLTGAAVMNEPGRGPVSWLLTMTADPDGWRISDVERA